MTVEQEKAFEKHMGHSVEEVAKFILRHVFMTIKPTIGRVLIEPVDAKPVPGSLVIIPDAHKQKSSEAIVVRLGAEAINENGTKVPWEVKPLDRILVSAYAGTDIEVHGRTYKLLYQSDIIAVLDEAPAQPVDSVMVDSPTCDVLPGVS